MSEIPEHTDPLLQPLADAQQHLLAIIGDALLENGSWPVFQYVEGRLDGLGLDIEDVLAGVPYFSNGSLNYALIWRDRNAGDEGRVRLTIAGMAHIVRLTSTVTMFMCVVNALAERRAAAQFQPDRVVTVEVPGAELIADLGLEYELLVKLLPELLGTEPPTWRGQLNRDGDKWAYQPEGQLRRFRGVTGVNDYLSRMRAWIMPPVPAAVPEPVSPFGLVAAFDHLDAVWELKFGSKLVYVPSAERTARLASPVTTADEFDSRLSALGELFKGMDAYGQGHGSFADMREFLRGRLLAESMPAVLAAIGTLANVTHVRNAGQHVGAAPDAALALPALGLAYPVTDHAMAWQTVQAQVINALDTIRDEVRALPQPQRPRRPSTSSANRGRRAGARGAGNPADGDRSTGPRRGGGDPADTGRSTGRRRSR